MCDAAVLRAEAQGFEGIIKKAALFICFSTTQILRSTTENNRMVHVGELADCAVCGLVLPYFRVLGARLLVWALINLKTWYGGIGDPVVILAAGVLSLTAGAGFVVVVSPALFEVVLRTLCCERLLSLWCRALTSCEHAGGVPKEGAVSQSWSCSFD